MNARSIVQLIREPDFSRSLCFIVLLGFAIATAYSAGVQAKGAGMDRLAQPAPSEQIQADLSSGNESSSADMSKKSEVSLSSGQIDQLVGLLENPRRREIFLDNLKKLREASLGTQPDASLKVSDILAVDEIAVEIVDDYSSFLSDIGLSSNQAGRILLMVVAIGILMVGVLINNTLVGFVDSRFSVVRRRLGIDPHRFSILFRMLRWLGYAMAIILVAYTAIEVFSTTLGLLVSEDFLQNTAQMTLTLFLVAAGFFFLWEGINAVVECYFGQSRLSSNARIRTLVPLIRNLLLFVLTVMSILVLLSELDIDVMPLLAGAGVFGIAIGFGAQTLVKDFLTGFTILLEDLLQIGDIVTVGGRTGEVTHITMRKIELRALDGTVHTIPFSEISVVDNLTKHYSYYMLEIGVAYRENTDEVIDCLNAVDEEMRQSEDYGPLILEPLEVLGVDAFADSAVVIKARTKTQAHEKWSVGREFNRRIKQRFDREGIEIPFPHQTLYFGESKSGEAPPARVALENERQQAEVTSRSSATATVEAS